MALQTIDLGASDNDGNGEDFRDGGIKINALITDYNAKFSGVPHVGIRLALESDLQAVADAIPADVTDEVTIRWQSAARVRTGDALYAFIQSTLAWTTGQMTTLMADAAAYD